MNAEGQSSNLLGKTEDGFIMVRCPSCSSHLKFDSLRMKVIASYDETTGEINGKNKGWNGKEVAMYTAGSILGVLVPIAGLIYARNKNRIKPSEEINNEKTPKEIEIKANWALLLKVLLAGIAILFILIILASI